MPRATKQPTGATARPSQRATPKIQRWVDLLAALLVRNWPATFEELSRQVPAYATSASDDARMRMFERDKDELRAFGVPIETVDGDPVGYRLRKEEFYLQYLSVVGESSPKRVKDWGYRALRSLTFEPDELAAVAEAAARARALGDPALASHATGALRKLAFDLPVDAAAAGEAHLVAPRARPDPAVLEALGAALLARKRVTFDYRAMTRDETASRTVEPWGIFFLNGHWYLAARDPQRGDGRAGLRNYRVSRIANVAPNGRKPQERDFDVPPDFRLRDHAQSRQAWELGDGEAEDVTVAFLADTGATRPAMRLGEDVPGDPSRRRFRVRRRDAFVRWLLAFGGSARPVAPAAVVEAFDAQLRQVRDRYASDAPAVAAAESRVPLSSTIAASDAGGAGGSAQARAVENAAQQLRRILELVPRVADGEPHRIADIARRLGVDGRTLVRDLEQLSVRCDVPGGFVEGLQIFVDADVAELQSVHFLRPMRLTAAELRALELGLAMLAAERPPEEQRAIAGARARLRAALARVPGDDHAEHALLDGALAGPLDDAQRAALATLRQARLARRKVRIVYRKARGGEATARVVWPYALVAASGAWYAIAWCESSSALRVFRVDRIDQASFDGAGAAFELPDDFSVHAVLRDGRAFQHDVPPRALVVRYGPAVARWIAEREGRALDADGSVTVTHPLADVDWAVRHVLQYGADAEVLEPADVRAEIARRLDAMLGGEEGR